MLNTLGRRDRCIASCLFQLENFSSIDLFLFHKFPLMLMLYCSIVNDDRGMHDDRSHSLTINIIICHYVHYKYINIWSQIIIDYIIPSFFPFFNLLGSR